MREILILLFVLFCYSSYAQTIYAKKDNTFLILTKSKPLSKERTFYSAFEYLDAQNSISSSIIELDKNLKELKRLNLQSSNIIALSKDVALSSDSTFITLADLKYKKLDFDIAFAKPLAFGMLIQTAAKPSRDIFATSKPKKLIVLSNSGDILNHIEFKEAILKIKPTKDNSFLLLSKDLTLYKFSKELKQLYAIKLDFKPQDMLELSDKTILLVRDDELSKIDANSKLLLTKKLDIAYESSINTLVLLDNGNIVATGETRDDKDVDGLMVILNPSLESISKEHYGSMDIEKFDSVIPLNDGFIVFGSKNSTPWMLSIDKNLKIIQESLLAR